ncbi:uncharacterized protein LOC118437052 [Folsomia candida]|uniref:uncharacterized protein LOC118437052 n=1 Tax=Folsomia candida TaxID=158441 RepID=UPI0016053AC1|nr:uncharacterized protein LOC118437052 [Folsomia candida]
MKPVALSISLVFLLLGISGQVKSSATSQPQPDAVNPGTNGEIAFKGKCSPTDKCKYANVSCIDGICQCKQGQFFTALMRDQQGCFDIVQIHNIATVEDHPRVIINQTCLQSPERNNSCRSPCYTGLLVDVIRMIDNEIKNLENCTVTEMDSVGTLDTSSDPPSWNTGLMAIVAKKQTDLALVPFNVSKQRPEIKTILDYSSLIIRNPHQNTYLTIGLPHLSRANLLYFSMIHLFTKLGHSEKLLNKWFIQGTSLWSKEKQKTPYTPTAECHLL